MSIRIDIAKKGGITFFGSVTGAGLRFLSEVVAARILTVSEFGVFGLCVTIVAIAQVLVSGGVRAVMQRYAAIYFDQGDYRRLLSLVIRIAIVLLILLPAAVAIVLYWADPLASWAGEARVADQVALFVWAIPSFVIIYVVGDFFRAIHRVMESTLIREVLPAALFLIGLMLLVLLELTEIENIIMMFSLSLLPAAMLAVSWVITYIQRMDIPIHAIVKENDAQRGMVTFAFSSAILQALWIFRERVTIFLVSHEMSAEDVSLYFVAIRFLLAISLIRAALNSLLTPKVAALYKSGRIDELREYYSIVTRWTLLAVAPFVIGISYFGGEIAAFVFGSHYGEAGPVIMIIFVLQVLSLSLGPSSITVQMSGRPQIEIALLLLSLPTIILVSKALMTPYHLIGAAGGMYGVMLMFDGLRMLYVKKMIGIEPMTRRNALGVVMLVVIWTMSYLLLQEVDSIFLKIVLLLCAVAGIGAVIWISLIERTEKRWLSDKLGSNA